MNAKLETMEPATGIEPATIRLQGGSTAVVLRRLLKTLNGAATEARTRDPSVTKAVLCQLSYRGIFSSLLQPSVGFSHAPKRIQKAANMRSFLSSQWGSQADSNRRPLPYQGSVLDRKLNYASTSCSLARVPLERRDKHGFPHERNASAYKRLMHAGWRPHRDSNTAPCAPEAHALSG